MEFHTKMWIIFYRVFSTAMSILRISIHLCHSFADKESQILKKIYLKKTFDQVSYDMKTQTISEQCHWHVFVY